jgi:hypothetical protein
VLLAEAGGSAARQVALLGRRCVCQESLGFSTTLLGALLPGKSPAPDRVSGGGGSKAAVRNGSLRG